MQSTLGGLAFMAIAAAHVLAVFFIHRSRAEAEGQAYVADLAKGETPLSESPVPEPMIPVIILGQSGLQPEGAEAELAISAMRGAVEAGQRPHAATF
jgi:hypothetical protein